MKRHALFVGVNTYEDKTIRSLRYSVPDASVLADRFEALGFRSRLLSDPTAAQMKTAVEETVAGLGPGDVFLFFFSGHGFTAQDGAHLLFCRDDRQKLLRVNGAGTRVDSLEMLAEGPFHRAFLLDSCRSDALAGVEEKGGGSTKDLDFVSIAPSTGSTFILRSCNKFLPSLEIDRLGHGLFTRGLLDAIDCRDTGLAKCGDAFAESVRVHMNERAKEVGAGFGQCPSIQLDGPAFSLFGDAFVTNPLPDGGATHSGGRYGTAASVYVVCPICGKKNRAEDTFRCRECGRDDLCLDHRDSATYLCLDCVGEIKRREEAERKAREEAERKARKEAEPKPDGQYTETVNGLTWNFVVKDGKAVIGFFDGEQQIKESAIPLDRFGMPEGAVIGRPVGAIAIPSSLGGHPVTRIGPYALKRYFEITSVSIPDTVTSIGNYAFYYCDGLTTVKIPNSVTKIGDNAFYGCSRLTSVSIPDSVTSIGSSAFCACSRLTSVSIPDSVTSIGAYAFCACSRLTSVSIPNSVTSIGSYAFSSCSRLTFVSIPNAVTCIGDRAFANCGVLASVRIPNSVTCIKDGTFEGCSMLKSVEIPDSVTTIGNYAFHGCRELAFTPKSVPSSVASIGVRAFGGCIQLSRIAKMRLKMRFGDDIF